MKYEVKQMNLDNLAVNEMDMEISPSLISNLIEWMRNKGISDEDIVECMLYICKKKRCDIATSMRLICDRLWR